MTHNIAISFSFMRKKKCINYKAKNLAESAKQHIEDKMSEEILPVKRQESKNQETNINQKEQ